MRLWKVSLLVYSLLSLFPSVSPADELLDCTKPKEVEALALASHTQSVCVLAKELAPSAAVAPEVVSLIDESIKEIGGRLSEPNGFSRCWHDSFYDCGQLKEDTRVLGNLIETLDEAAYSDPSIATLARTKRAALKEQMSSLIQKFQFFCRTLRR